MPLETHSLNREALSPFGSKDLVGVQCSECLSEFSRAKNFLLAHIKHGTRPYCSASCAARAQQGKKGNRTLSLACAECGAQTSRSTKEIRASKSGLSFCSRSCAASARNRGRKNGPPLSPRPPCVECGTAMERSRTKRCPICIASQKIDINVLTLSELKYAEGPSSVEAKWSKVRGRARTQHASLLKDGCENCEYSKHVEICHIRAITDFPSDATIAEVNRRDNVLALCRNCHWEMDHGLLDDDAPIRTRLGA